MNPESSSLVAKGESDDEKSVVYVDDEDDDVEDDDTESVRSRAKPVFAAMMPSKSPSDALDGRWSEEPRGAPLHEQENPRDQEHPQPLTDDGGHALSR